MVVVDGDEVNGGNYDQWQRKAGLLCASIKSLKGCRSTGQKLQRLLRHNYCN